MHKLWFTDLKHMLQALNICDYLVICKHELGDMTEIGALGRAIYRSNTCQYSSPNTGILLHTL